MARAGVGRRRAQVRRLLSNPTLSFTLCALMLAAAGCVPTTPESPAPGAGKGSVPDVLTPQERAEIFRQVWETINEHYYDPNFRGVDWRAVGERYRPQAESARGDAEFYGVFELMLAELRYSTRTYLTAGGAWRARASSPT